MSIKSTSKVVAAVVGFTMALTIVAGASNASAQAMSLTDLVNLFISLGIISPDKAAAAKAAVANSGSSMSASFSKDLSVGSSGADVTALQNALGVSPATGYFGSVTKAAVMAYQSAHGVPATGFVGPLTRASLNGSSSGSVVTGGSSTPVVNTGVEGILTVDKSSVSNSTLYEGQTNVPVLAVKLTAKLSPISIQRLQLNLGQDTSFYTKVFKTLYVVDASGKVLAQADLNSNTVVKSSNDYLLTLGGFNYTVPKDAPQILTVTGDLYSTIPSTQLAGTQTVTLVTNGVRGTDGAGIDQYGPSTGTIAQTLTFSASLVDSAQLLISTDAANFLTSDVVAANGSNNNEYDKLPLLAFDLRAQKDTVQVTDLTATISSTGTGNATATSAYLYDGSTLLGSASVNSSTGVANFTDINYWVPKDTTKVLTIKADIRNAGNTVTVFSATVANGGVSAENSEGSSVSGGNKTGSASGNSFSVRKVGPVFTLNSASIVKSATASQNNFSTSTANATFNLTIQAVGGDIYFGNQTEASTFAFGIFQNGASASLSNSQSVAWSRPSNSVVALTGAQAFKLAQNNSVMLPVDFVFEGRTTAGALLSTGSYAVGLTSIKWSTSEVAASTTSNFMSGQTAWRTPAVSLP